MKKIRLAITIGDPAGIGPEVVLKALQELVEDKTIEILLIGPYHFWRTASEMLNFPFCLEISNLDNMTKTSPQTIRVISIPDFEMAPVIPGISTPFTGRIAGQAIEYAVQLALQKAVDAIVTAPIQKESLNQAGYHFPGHTEMLQSLTGSKSVKMIMYSPKLSTILISTHVAIQETAVWLTENNLLETIQMGVQFIQNLKKPPFRIAVAAYNPHTGEGGLFGSEEITIIAPTIQKARQMGLPVEGPFSPDTVFANALQGKYDLVVAMYHDQGLIPFKLVAFDEGVNVTAGLPFWRTSPDHGTALDLAGKNQANHHSMLEAIRLAARLAANTLSLR
ncbi:4-hydroxythreonine-4-phosphate dehydrogenase PdxA [candidate division KSB1 bacterium]|nr:4-hydroxythreonine-4-phosphate dehydrogenase PdxA [candidate division KSB1 bacterium]